MHCGRILDEIRKIAEKVAREEFDRFIDLLIRSPRIYVVGAGRSGLVVKAFAMRLVHLKKKVFVIGETITPAMRKGDTLLAVSGSGSTSLVVDVARTAKKVGGKIAGITTNKASELAKLSDVLVIIPSEILRREVTGYESRNLMGLPAPPMGSLFEISTLIFFEACVLELMIRLKVDEEEMKRIHANL